MDKRHYHSLSPARPLCPVCKRAVYSRGGIHPQCAVAQAERPGPKVPGVPVPVDGQASVTPTPAIP